MSSVDQYVSRYENDGFVVIEDAIPPAVFAEVRAAFTHAMDAKVAQSGLRPVARRDESGGPGKRIGVAFEPKGGNHDVNRWNMKLPSRMPFLDEHVVANPVALAVLRRVLGEGVVNYLVSSDTAYPGSSTQNFHRDSYYATATINIPLVDFTEDNGPTEIWPGTHRQTPDSVYSRGNVHDDADTYERARAAAPVRILARAGSLVVRDQRAIHRGTVNHTDTPRPMLSMLYRVPPADVPYKRLHTALGEGARLLRKRALGSDGAAPNAALMKLGNRLGAWYETMGCTDRYGKRALPHAVWEAFSPEARSLFRYATVQDMTADDPGETRRTWAGSRHMLEFTARNVWNTAKGQLPPELRARLRG